MNQRMILALAILVSLSFGVAATGQKKESCWESAKTQGEMNRCASSELQAADAELNRVYSALLKAYGSDSVHGKKLQSTQGAWLAYRDAHLEFCYPAADPREYGSVNPMCRAILLTGLTEERVKTLKQIQSAEEGDVCLGHLRVSGP